MDENEAEQQEVTLGQQKVNELSQAFDQIAEDESDQEESIQHIQIKKDVNDGKMDLIVHDLKGSKIQDK